MIFVHFFILGFYFLKLVVGYMLYNRADCIVQKKIQDKEFSQFLHDIRAGFFLNQLWETTPSTVENRQPQRLK